MVHESGPRSTQICPDDRRHHNQHTSMWQRNLAVLRVKEAVNDRSHGIKPIHAIARENPDSASPYLQRQLPWAIMSCHIAVLVWTSLDVDYNCRNPLRPHMTHYMMPAEKMTGIRGQNDPLQVYVSYSTLYKYSRTSKRKSKVWGSGSGINEKDTDPK